MTAPKQNVLVLYAHPASHKSRVNKRLAQAARAVQDVTFHDLYEAYPDFAIDVPTEQKLLQRHDVVVWQHPLYWYSTPAIFKEWQDLVLTHGWAYGSEGTALHGKRLLNALSTGGRRSAYCEVGYNRFTIRQLLAPMEQTAYLCGMEYSAPFVVHGTHALTTEEIDEHAADYARLLTGIRDDCVDWEAARDYARLNDDLDAILKDNGRAR